jgi:two-component system, OmpR family, sensor histidine kinase SenX3
MRVASRQKAVAFFVVLGSCLVALAVALNISWVILNWREGVLLLFGVIFFGLIIAGMILNTLFLVREIRRNEQHDSFINAVTHELKTPIASIRLYLETLQRRDVTEKQRREFYELMLLDTDRLMGTVKQVLKAGEVGYKHVVRERVEVDFPELVSQSMELARTRHHLPPEALRFPRAAAEAAEKNARKKPIRVTGDPEELRTAVYNLFDNAVKYSGKTVDITVGIDTPDDETVSLWIRDRGVGIPAHDLKRIFKRFYRVPARNMKGTGLGLFIVRAIARAHGGKVFAQSEGEGRGTTVTMELPRSEA